MADAAKMADVPLYIVQAEHDDTVDVSSSYEMYNALVESGSTKVKLKIYSDEEMNEAGVDGTIIGYHTVEMAALSADYDGEMFMSWLFAQTNAEDSQTDPGQTDPGQTDPGQTDPGQKDPTAPENPVQSSGNDKGTERTPGTVKTARTEDASTVGVWAVLVCAAATAAIVTVCRKKRGVR